MSSQIRCPIHGFIELSDLERDIINTNAFQRLRQIHQLAMTYLVYPGATHTRFEHLLGAMHLGGRLIGILDEKYHDVLVSEINWNYERARILLRVAALLHDIGHAPFSHGAEEALFPKDWGGHENMGANILRTEEFTSLFKKHSKYGISVEEVIFVMTGKSDVCEIKDPSAELSFLTLLITGAFGVDRMDYLLRDSYHTGVYYGRFDLERLLHTLAVVSLPSGPQLGVDEDGIYAAEFMLMARYFMFLQVYNHDVRRIYDKHLVDYMSAKYGMFPIDDVGKYLTLTDSRILIDIGSDASKVHDDSDAVIAAKRIHSRKHFRALSTSFVNTKFFKTEVVPAIEDALGSDKKKLVYFDSPSIRIYKEDELQSIYVKYENGSEPRTIFDESQFLWNVVPALTNRIYVDLDPAVPDESVLRNKLDDVCKKLREKENQKIAEIRQHQIEARNQNVRH